mgnify:FL=1
MYKDPAMNNYAFNEPLQGEPDGSYITFGQMQFFLLREEGKELFQTGSEEFWDYYNMCRVYNLVSEIMEYDPKAAMLYWNSKQGTVSMGYPAKGEVAEAISHMEPAIPGHDEELDDWGTGLN